MATKISALASASDVATNDLIQVIDVSDTTMAGSGTNKKATAQVIGNFLPVTATGSSASRVLKDRFADIVNVKDFGATGNGTTDDTIAIQAALTAGSGGKVFLPEGIYKTTNALTIPSNTWFCGSGAGSVIRSLTLTNGGSGLGHRQVSCVSVSGILISNLKFDAGDMTGFTAGMRSIYMFESSDYAIKDCVFITPGAAVASLNCTRYSITNNDIDIQSTTGAALHDGIIDQWYGSHDFIISKNHIRGNSIGNYAIMVTGTDTASENPTPVYDFVISENHIFDCREVGIWAMGRSGSAYNFQITNNIVKNIINYYGIAVTNAYDFVVNGNIVKDTYYNSIRAYNEDSIYGSIGAQYGVISNNIFENANASSSTSVDTGSAISVTDQSKYVEVANNVVNGSSHRYAVFLGTSTSNINVKGECFVSGVVGFVLNQATLASTNTVPGANLYQPTLTAVANVSAFASYNTTTYQKTGNVVKVYGRLEITPTAASNTVTQLGISLPIASNFTSVNDASGIGSTAFGLVSALFADVTNDRITLQFPSPNTSNNVISFNFQYIIK